MNQNQYYSESWYYIEIFIIRKLIWKFRLQYVCNMPDGPKKHYFEILTLTDAIKKHSRNKLLSHERVSSPS